MYLSIHLPSHFSMSLFLDFFHSVFEERVGCFFLANYFFPLECLIYRNRLQYITAKLFVITVLFFFFSHFSKFAIKGFLGFAINWIG